MVVSIFVNPAQFGPGEDFEAYPRDAARDSGLLEQAGVDLLFSPAAGEIYAPGHATWIEVERLGDGLCGASRPGHFRGVATIVAKLLNIVQPDAAYFGQKDWQQAVIVRRMAQDLDFPTAIHTVPTVRDSDGLALSSRNAYLTPSERSWAPRLHQALQEAAAEASRPGRTAADLKQRFEASLQETPLRIQYIEIRGANDLVPMETLHGEIVIAAAVHLGSTRLIDNVLLELPDREVEVR